MIRTLYQDSKLSLKRDSACSTTDSYKLTEDQAEVMYPKAAYIYSDSKFSQNCHSLDLYQVCQIPTSKTSLKAKVQPFLAPKEFNSSKKNFNSSVAHMLICLIITVNKVANKCTSYLLHKLLGVFQHPGPKYYLELSHRADMKAHIC